MFFLLNKLFLYFLPAVIIPLLIHLLFRKKKRIYYSNISLIQDILSQKKIFKKWQKQTLLAIRILFLLFLILAFTRPWLYYSKEAKPSKDTSVVFLFDSSCSLNYNLLGETEFEKNKKVALNLLEQLPRTTKIGVISYSDKIEHKSTGLAVNHEKIKNEILGLKPTVKKTDHRLGLTAAETFMTESVAGSKNIIWFSDSAISDFEKDTALSKTTNVTLITEKTAKRNLTIANIVQNINNTITAEIRSFGFDGNVSLILYEDGSEMARTAVNLKHGNNKAEIFLKPSANKKYSLEIKSDNLTEDNIYRFIPEKTEQPNVLLVDGNPLPGYRSELYYITAALNAMNFRFETIGFHQFASYDLKRIDAIIISNYLPDENILKKLTGGDKKIIFFPGDNVEDGKTILDVSLSRKIEKRTTFVPGEKIKEIFGEDQKFDWRVSAQKFFKISYERPWEPFFFDTEANPLLISKGDAFIFNTSANKSWSNMISKAFFAPLLEKILSPKKEFKDIYAFAGEPVKWKYAETSGATIKLNDRIAGIYDTIPTPEKPGFYEITFLHKELKKSIFLVVNTNPSESDLTQTSDLKIKNASVFIVDRKNWRKTISIVLGRDSSLAAWIIVLFLLAAENIFVYFLNRGGR